MKGRKMKEPILGNWPPDCIQRAFVAGVAWWQFHANDSIISSSERQAAENEAVRRYGEPVANWQPIATAPTTGRSPIFLWREGMDFPQLAFSNTWWQGGFSHGLQPTHWMPMPAPPDTQ